MTTMRYTADRDDQHPRAKPAQPWSAARGSDRRAFRRHDLEQQGITVKRCDGTTSDTLTFGRIVDLSASGVRIRTTGAGHIKPDHQIRVRIELPVYAGICPFIDTTGNQPEPKREWVGWMTVARVMSLGGDEYEVAGRLVDMDEMDRGMLGLYLSTQPMAA
jgi:hypothetical protein